MAPLILYDLPSKGRQFAWSLNPWKTRMALNYKNIEYKTEWTEYPDVAPTLSAAGIPPNETGVAYTIPAVQLTDGTYIMESMKIAHAIEKQYPTPSLHLDDGVVSAVDAMIPAVFGELTPVWMPRVPRILGEKSAEYFYRTREERMGMPLDQYEKEKGGEHLWKAAKEPIEKLAALLKKTDGPYFLGDEVSYADFILVSALHFAKVLGQDFYDRIVAHDKALDDLYKACAKWLERGDH